jgi:hypothetical protein
MLRRLLLVVVLVVLLPQHATAAPSRPSAQDIAEAMRACLPVAAIEQGSDGWFTVTVDSAPESFLVMPGRGANAEHYQHWWNYEVQLVFVRYGLGWERPAPLHEMRAWRNRIIQCFYAVPPVPDDFSEL